MFCKYKDLLGVPNKGIHKYRVFDIAIVDVLLTVIGSFLIHISFPKNNFFIILSLVFLAGIICHRIFCVRTTIDKLLFGD